VEENVSQLPTAPVFEQESGLRVRYAGKDARGIVLNVPIRLDQVEIAIVVGIKEPGTESEPVQRCIADAVRESFLDEGTVSPVR